MPYSTAGKNAMLDHLRTLADFVSVHTGNPGDTGASEVSGGSYARGAITFNAASAGSIDSSAQPDINIPSGTTVTHLGFWSAATGGTFYGSGTIASETYGSAGVLSVVDANLDLNS